MIDTLERINKIFKIVFNKENLTITEQTCPNDIEGWDSLPHVRLLTLLEEEFNVKFDINQIISMETVGDIVRVIDGMR